MPDRPAAIIRKVQAFLDPELLLDQESWKKVQDALAGLAAALDADDPGTIASVMFTIERLGVRRISRPSNPEMGRPDGRPASEGTRDLVNRIVDRLAPDPDRPTREGGSSR